MRSPICWFGGKGKMLKKLLPLIPEHSTYVEVFGGAGSLLFSKDPSRLEVYNDIDDGLVNLFSVLRDQFEELNRLCTLTPYSRKIFDNMKEQYHTEEDPVKKAWMFFTIARQSFSGNWGCGWSYSVAAHKQFGANLNSYLSSIERLPQIAERLMKVQIECRDFRDIVKYYDSKDCFFYLDPPYIPDTRSSGKYKHEISIEDHQDLADILLSVEGKVLLSGYDDGCTYNILEDNGWIKESYNTSNSSCGRTRYTSGKKVDNPILGKGSACEASPRIECVWMNYDIRKQMRLF